MPHPALHFSLLSSLALACRVSPRGSLLLGLLAMLPDLDVIFGVHRSPTHSMLLLACALPVALAFKFVRSRKNFALASLALLSHPILDLFDGFTPILWPLLDRSLYLRVGLSGAELLSSNVIFPPCTPASCLSHALQPLWQVGISAALILACLALRRSRWMPTELS